VCPKISKTIEIHQNRQGLENGRFTGEIPYFLALFAYKSPLILSAANPNPSTETVEIHR